MTRGEALLLFEQISQILKGIDEEETDSIDGWWETERGAELGRHKLAALRRLILSVSDDPPPHP